MRSLLRLWPYMRPYRGRYALGIVLVVLGSVLAIASPLIVRAAFDRLDRGDVAVPIAYFVAALVVAGLAKALVVFKGRYTIIAASRRVEYDLRNQVYRKLLRLPAGFYDRHASGDVQSRAINDVEGARMIAGISIVIIASSVILFFFSLAAMFSIYPRLAWIAMSPLVFVGAVIALVSRQEFRQSERVQERLAALNTLAQENFSGARVIRAFSREPAECRRFARASAAYKKAALSVAGLEALAWTAMPILVEAAIGLTLIVGGLGIIRGTFSKGDFVAFTAYQFMLSWPVMVTGWAVALLQRGAACMDRIALILDEPEAESPLPAQGLGAPAQGGVEIRDLTFRYAQDRPPALQGVSLRIAPGERVALVGRTGSGKSTLAQILLGLYAPPPGTVLIDGKDINAYPRGALRESLSGVLQDNFLFSDAIAANIAFGARGPASAEEVAWAAESAHLSGDLAAFPQGIDQIIGERGITLSGGQKQRTAIARALLRHPCLLILDDALSSVDVDTERAILEKLGEYLAGKTCLIVTHRFSCVSLVDRVLVFDEGRLVEAGTHAELAARGGLYTQLLTRQRLEEALKQA